MQLKQWIRNQVPLANEYDIAGVVFTELYAKSNVTAELDQVIKFDSYQRSFSYTQVIVCLEVLTLEHLNIVHDFLADRCCDIENFRVLLIGHTGSYDFWYRYNEIIGRATFSIIEVLDLPYGVKSIIDEANPNYLDGLTAIKAHWRRSEWYSDFDLYQPNFNRQIDHSFLYLPGRNNNSVEDGYAKQYLALEMLTVPGCHVDLNYQLPDKDALLYWVEKANSWRVPPNVEHLNNSWEWASQQPVREIPTDVRIFDSGRELFYKSFATVVRETVMMQPYGCIGEKTLRAFYYGQVVIPVTRCGVSALRHLGFEFIDDIPYDHDELVEFGARCQRLGQNLRYFSAEHSKRDLELLLLKHRDLLCHNSDLARNLTYFISE